MVKSVGQPSEDRWIEGKRDAFGVPHAKPAEAQPLEQVTSPIRTGKAAKAPLFHTLPKRSIPSQHVWRSENVFGRIVNFFEQSVLILGKIWPSRSPKVDQRLMASLHGQRIAAVHPSLRAAPLGQVLKYTIRFLETQKGETAPPREVLKTLKQTAKWATTLEKIAIYSSYAKRQKLLTDFSKDLSKTIEKLPVGSSCVIPGGWREAQGTHPALYQITKNTSGTYQMKILSRDPSVNPQSVLMSAGKTKIHPETTFNDLTVAEISDPKWLQALLSLQMPAGGTEKGRGSKSANLLGLPGKTEALPDLTSLTGLLSPFADRIDLSPKSVEKFRTAIQSDTQMKNIWLLVDILGMESKGKALPGERRKLQLKVNSLFQFFQVVRKDLAENKTNQILLQEGVLNVSKVASLMYAQGKLTEAEVAVINRELAVIEKSIAKAMGLKTKKGKKNVFRLRSSLPTFTFKSSKFSPQSLHKSWTAPIVQPTPPAQPVSIAPLSADMKLKAIAKTAEPALPKVTTQNVHSVLQELKSECQELAKKEDHFALQKRIVEVLYAVELPEPKAERMYSLRFEGSLPSTRFHFTENEIKWSTLSAKEQADCGIALSELGELLNKSAKKTSTLTPEKTFLQVKSGFIQEYLARLNQGESGLTKDHVLTFWPDVLRVMTSELHKSGVVLRSYSEKAADLQQKMNDFYFTLSTCDIEVFQMMRKEENYHDKKTILGKNDEIIEYVNKIAQRPIKGVQDSPQLRAMEQAIEQFQSNFPLQILDVKPSRKAVNYTKDWSRKYEQNSLKKAVEETTFGRDFTEQDVRDEPAELLNRKAAEPKLPISKEDLGDILIVLGTSCAAEMMGLVRQKPYLLEFASVRSLIEQRLFGNKNLSKELLQQDYLGEKTPLAYHLATWIKEQTELFKVQGKVHETLFMMNLALSLTNLAPELPPKVGNYLDFPNYAGEIREWGYTALDPSKPEFAFRHALWTNLLLQHENAKELTGEQIADFLKGIMVLETASAEIYEFDPFLQARLNDLKEKWKEPIGEFLQKPEAAPLAKHVFDSICQIAQLPPPQGEWTGEFPVYRADVYEINLLEGIVKNTQGGWISRSIPIQVREDNTVKAAFSAKELQGVVANHSLKAGKDIYRFSDQQGRGNMIVASSKSAAAFKEVEIPRGHKTDKLWLQFVDKNTLFGIEEMKEERPHHAAIPTVFKMLSAAKQKDKLPAIPAIFDKADYSFWINPKKKSQIVVLNEKGIPRYQFILKRQLTGGRVITGVMDLSDETKGVKKFKKIGSLSPKADPIWQQLTALDTPKNITVWKSGKKIEKVELNRYSLAFVERDGKAVCTHPQLNGWILDAAPTSLKKGLKNSLVLRHPTIASQYRLIVPERNISPKQQGVESPLKFLFKALKSVMRGHLLSLDSKDPIAADWDFDESHEEQDFWIFDINPATLNLEEISKESVKPYLHAALLNYLENRPETSLEMLNQIRRVSKKWRGEDIQAVQKFIQLPIKTPDGVALRLQCALLGKKLAPPQYRRGMEASIAELYKEYLQIGSRISPVIKITPEDEIACLEALAIHDPVYFQANAPLLVSQGESRRMKARQIEQPYFPAQLEVKQKISQFSDKLMWALEDKPSHSSFDFLSRDVSQLGTEFMDLYKIASQESPSSAKFKELDLHLRALPNKGIEENYFETLQSYLTRVLDIRKEGTVIPFPEPPELDLSGKTVEIREQNDQTLNQFLQDFEAAITAADAATGGIKKEVPRIDLAEFDAGLFQNDLLAAINAAKKSESIDELTIGELEKALQARKPKMGAIPLANVGQALYPPEELKKFFKPLANRETVPQLDLTSLKNAGNPALKVAAESLDEEMRIAKQEIESDIPMEFLKGEKSRTALEKDLFSKKKEWTAKRDQARQDVMKLVQAKSSSAYELQQKAKLIKNIDLELLLKHFLQNDLEGLAANLPADISFEELRTALGNYLLFATEVQRFDAVLDEVKTLSSKKEAISPIAISGFYSQLSAERQYDPAQDPQLLLFEYMTNLLLRDSQLKMVQDFLQYPNCIRQAVTGAGKSTVILVLTALMQANGTNLVTVNFPKQLFEENLNDLQNKLGRIFERSVYPLQFNMNTPTVIEGEKSVFKEMYEDLLRTTLEKGIVISTLESQQALEQKWIRLMDQQSKQDPATIPYIEAQHLKYLTKIILFKRERDYTILDEFDKALNQREERHLKVGNASPIPKFIWETSLNLYDLFLAEPELGLQRNAQGALLTDPQRTAILDRIAGKVASQWATQKGLSASEKDFLKRYIIGEDEAILAHIQHWSLEELDAIAVIKDQFYTFLPLSLSKTCQVRYMRSEDGEHTVPCLASDIPRESSEFDQILEKINYTIQDYYQTGVRESFIKEWVASKKRLAEAGVMNKAYASLDDTPEAKVFAEYFPGRKLSNVLMSQIPELVQDVNSDPKKIRRFLEEALSKQEVSSGKISCDGNNLVSMSKHTAGASATLGSLHALPPSIQTAGAEDKGAIGKMVTTMLKKAQNPDGTLPPMVRYHPENTRDIIPAVLKKDPDIQVVIDGSGVAALHGLPFGLASKQLLENQPSGTKVRGVILGGEGNRQQVQTPRGIVGLNAAGLKPAELGGFFDESRARGADFKMMPGARAFITASSKQLFEEALQTVGRLRGAGQHAVYGTANTDPVKDVADLLKKSLTNSVEREADNLYRALKKDLRDTVRSAMIDDLLLTAQHSGINDMLNRYQDFADEDILITQKKEDLSQPGVYFANHGAINRMDKNPLDELNQLRESYLQIAQGLGLNQASDKLQTLTYSPELIIRLPQKVFGGSGQQLDQEVEVETETEIELEVETEKDTDKKVTKRSHDRWRDLYSDKYPNFIQPLKALLNVFDAKIRFTENFFPISQNKYKDPAKERVRQPHDDMQNPAHYVVIHTNKAANQLTEATLIDSLEFANRKFQNIEGSAPQVANNVYNMRLKCFVEGPLAQPGVQTPEAIKPELHKLLAQIRFFNGEYDQYSTEEFDALRVWLAGLKQTAPQTDMEEYFKKTVLKYKPEAQQNYPFSPLAKLFKELAKD